MSSNTVLRSSQNSRSNIKRVIIIDDDPVSVDRTRHALNSAGGFEVHASCSPLLGLELARQIQPDLVILDIVMPVYDGGDVKNMLRKVPALAQTPVILLSSLVGHDETNQDGFLLCGEDLMMAKPADPVKLLALVRSLLER